MTDRLEQLRRAVAVLDTGSGDDHDQHETERVGEHMALAALDLLAGVEAANLSTLRGFHALAVDHARRRADLAPLQLARPHDQHPVDGAEQADVGKHPPWAAVTASSLRVMWKGVRSHPFVVLTSISRASPSGAKLAMS